jgi:hypothetical protein
MAPAPPLRLDSVYTAPTVPTDILQGNQVGCMDLRVRRS